MTDLTADTQLLRDCATQLSRVEAEFSRHADPADGYDARELGSSKVTDVFSDFGANWSIHRRKLMDQIHTLGTITEAAAEAYDGVDKQLADALRKVDGAPGGTR